MIIINVSQWENKQEMNAYIDKMINGLGIKVKMKKYYSIMPDEYEAYKQQYGNMIMF